MDIRAAFPSNYVKAADLGGKPWTMVIRTCVLEDLGQGSEKERKPILYFNGAQKGLVLNKTNANVVAAAYGDDTAAWQGRPVEVFPTPVEFKGQMVDGIRLRVPQAAPQPLPQQPLPPLTPQPLAPQPQLAPPPAAAPAFAPAAPPAVAAPAAAPMDDALPADVLSDTIPF